MSDYLTVQEAAGYLGVSPSLLNKHRVNGTGPMYIKAGRIIRYRRPDIDIWMLRQRRQIVHATLPRDEEDADELRPLEDNQSSR